MNFLRKSPAKKPQTTPQKLQFGGSFGPKDLPRLLRPELLNSEWKSFASNRAGVMMASVFTLKGVHGPGCGKLGSF